MLLLVLGLGLWGLWCTVAVLQGVVDRMKLYEPNAGAGLLICFGPRLRVIYVDPCLVGWLGRPRHIAELLPPCLRDTHEEIVRRYRHRLPDSLHHPLRNVPILLRDGKMETTRLLIGSFGVPLLRLYYVVLQPSPALAAGTAKAEELAKVYGLDNAGAVGMGLLPSAEVFEPATVLFVDIVSFMSTCSRRSLSNVSDWMSRVHAIIDGLLLEHAVRKVETRGDCCICVTGTNFLVSKEAPTRDFAFDQVTRMLRFARALVRQLSEKEKTQVRVGMATGSVVLTHIAHASDLQPAKYIYGDTVNLAARMEQTGREGFVQMHCSAAEAYLQERPSASEERPSASEERPSAEVVWEEREVKGKGLTRVALFAA
jgi:class 3 adenylate cyclase